MTIKQWCAFGGTLPASDETRSVGNRYILMVDTGKHIVDGFITGVRVNTEKSVADAAVAYSCFAVTPDVTQHFVTQGPSQREMYARVTWSVLSREVWSLCGVWNGHTVQRSRRCTEKAGDVIEKSRRAGGIWDANFLTQTN